MLRFLSKLLVCLAPLGATSLWAQSSPIPQADYTVAHSFRIGGTAGWDGLALLDSGRRLFVARNDHVDVIDTSSGKMVGTISHTAGVHGVAFAPALNRGFTSNGQSNSVSVFELDTLRVIQELPVNGQQPDAIYYDPQHNYLITGNRDSSNLSVFEAGALRVMGSVALPGPPESITGDGAGHLYVNISSAPGKLVLIDAKNLAVRSRWPLKDCANPTALGLDATNHRIFSVCANQTMAVTDAVSGKNIARIVIGRGADAMGYDADLGLLFSANGIDGTLTVIHQESPDEYRVLATVTTQVSARTMALDPGTHKVYLAAAQFGPPPAATTEQPAPRGGIVPDSFLILVAQPK
jgi:DNA-binding beta-propeller fold protein YncE